MREAGGKCSIYFLLNLIVYLMNIVLLIIPFPLGPLFCSMSLTIKVDLSIAFLLLFLLLSWSCSAWSLTLGVDVSCFFSSFTWISLAFIHPPEYFDGGPPKYFDWGSVDIYLSSYV